MAEFAEYRTEEMLPEYEMMEKLEIFTNSEMRTVAKNRKEFEYKIQRRTKCKEDFLLYIQYEMDLLKLIRDRKEVIGIPSTKSEIEFSIANRVNNIFKQACHRFQDDVKLCLAYIKFCEKMRFNSNVSHILVKMLQFHGADKAALWKFAANWEMEQGHSVENARQFILRGLRFHPESTVLYAEAFRLELMYASMMREKKIKAEEGVVAEKGAERASGGLSSPSDIGTSLVPEEALGVMAPLGNIGIAGEAARDQVMEGKLAMSMYESAVKKVKDVGFVISLLSIAKEFDFTQHLQEKIVNDLVNCFQNEELTWDTMARRELEGLSYNPIDPKNSIPPTQTTVIVSPPSSVLNVVPADPPIASNTSVLPQTSVKGTKAMIKPKASLKERIRSCCAVYDAGVKKLDTERMWSLYIECLLELLANGSGSLDRIGNAGQGGNTLKKSTSPRRNPFPVFTRKLILKAFRAAHNAHKMTEKYYLMWVDILQGDNTPSTNVAALSGNVKKGLKGLKGKAPVRNGAGTKNGKNGKRAVGQHKKVACILAAATERLPQSSELWMTRLRHHINQRRNVLGNKRNESKEPPVNEVDASGGSQPSSSGTQTKTPIPEMVFAKASEQLGDVQDAVPIWKFMLHYTQAKGDIAGVESLFHDAIKKGPAIALAFKPLYIEWIVLSQGIIVARRVYDQISVQPPLCLEMHTKMAHFEGMQPKVNLKHARKCFELACDQFGKSNTDVWMEYVKFEMHKGSPENITAIYWRAVGTLDNLQGDIFMSEFSLLKTGMATVLTPTNATVKALPGVNTPMALG